MKPRLAFTIGDCNGIGPEIVLKAAADRSIRRVCEPILVGPEESFRHYRGKLDVRFLVIEPQALREEIIPFPFVPLVRSSEFPVANLRPGVVDGESGKAAAKAIECAVQLALRGSVEGIVTAPISKQAFHAGGVEFPGHTEMLRELTGTPEVAMMLVSGRLRVGLATIHVPLRDVPRLITQELLRSRIGVVRESLRMDWRISRPRIAVLGLNPHAGEGGEIGREERDVIEPAIRSARELGIDCHGPFPADAFFAELDTSEWDAVFAMYHDQGLIPLKMSGWKRSVNVTAGLPIVRTSPGHGTAFDIAGKSVADPAPFIEAARIAALIVRNRQAQAGRRSS